MFEITTDHIRRLNDADARTLVGLLAEQEAIRHGADASSITFGGDQRAQDGGIDVRASLPDSLSPEGYIPRRQTGYQVKAEKFAGADINREMRPSDTLRDSIKNLGKEGGSYIIVSSQDNCSDIMLSSRRKAMAAAISDTPEAADLFLDFYDQNRLARWVNHHPGLVPWVRKKIGEPLNGWRPFDDWSSTPEEASAEYIIDDHIRLVGVQLKDTSGLDARAGIQHVRSTLKKASGTVRLVGLSGVGKTRFAQALFDDRIGDDALQRSKAIYTDLSDGPDPTPLELLGRLIGLKQECVLIVDNCGVELHRKLAARLRQTESGVRVLTIEYDISDDEPENTDVFKLEPSSPDVLEHILERRYSQLSKPDIRTIASFSEGNARVAIALAETAKSGESLTNLSDSELFKRLFIQKKDESPALLLAAKAMSLVYSFDGSTLEGDNAELPLLADLAGQSVEEFYGHVSELKRRKLVQSRGKWRALLPHALAHKLAKEFLQDRPPTMIVDKLLRNAGDRLLLSFSRRLGFLHESPEAREIVASFLSSDGWLHHIERLSQCELIFLDNVAPVDPKQVLANISATRTRLGSLEALPNPAKQETKRLLRALAYEPDTFEAAITLLCETISLSKNNNMSTTHDDFVSLFHLYLSGTHATATQRAGLLAKLAKVGDQKAVTLVICGLEAMLRTEQFSSLSNFEFGARKRDFGWQPSTGQDVHHWYASALFLFKDLLDNRLVPTEQLKSIFASHFLDLARRGLADEIIPLAEHIATEHSWPEGWSTVSSVAKEAMSGGYEELAKRYSDLANILEPKDLAHRIAVYVLPDRGSSLDLAEIDVDSDASDVDKYERAHARIEHVCAAIGAELAQSDAEFSAHVGTLVRSTSARVSSLGKGLAKSHKNPETAWSTIEDALRNLGEERNYSLRIATGFLEGLENKNPSLVEAFLDRVFASQELRKFFLPLQCSVSLSDRGWARIISSLNQPDIPVYGYEHLAYWPARSALNVERLDQLATLLPRREQGFAAALHVFHLHLWRGTKGEEPPAEGERAAARKLLRQIRFENRGQTNDFEIKSLCEAALRPGLDEPIAKIICERLLEAMDKGHVYGWDYPRLIEYLAKHFPLPVLNILVERADEDKPLYGRNRIFESYRDKSFSPINLIDSEVVISWANENPSRRFDLLGSITRPWRQSEDDASVEWSPMALEILLAAPNPATIIHQFFERIMPMAWHGSRAELMESRLPLFDALVQREAPVIASTARAARARFEQEIAKTRERETLQRRERDERFDW
ncbi:hypothetical protein [Woodsholea maritima]|uniref:hypothetical protein n=1 Tax=Woodsholea maritima TaxID=240237 RepID=UPI00036C138C|nr:hypothetical protein [Woodsholea maritima]